MFCVRHFFQERLLKTLAIRICCQKLTWIALSMQHKWQMLMNLSENFQKGTKLILDQGVQFWVEAKSRGEALNLNSDSDITSNIIVVALLGNVNMITRHNLEMKIQFYCFCPMKSIFDLINVTINFLCLANILCKTLWIINYRLPH